MTTPQPEKAAKGSMVTVLVALAANCVIAVLKTIVAVITASASMIAEATHSWADAGNEIFLFIAERQGDKPADKVHPMGYGRAAYVWSMVAAFGLFAVGSAVSIIHGVQALSAPEGATDYTWAYAILGASFVLEGVSFLQARKQLRAGAQAAEISPLDYLARTSHPTLRAVFFEDAAALIGLVIAALGILLHQFTGNPIYDAAGSILVGVLLGFVAVYLLSRNMAFLVGEVADDKVRNAALTWLLSRPEVTAVTELYMEYIGPGRLFVVAALDLDGDDPESTASAELATLEAAMMTHPTIRRATLTLSAPGAEPLAVAGPTGSAI